MERALTGSVRHLLEPLCQARPDPGCQALALPPSPQELLCTTLLQMLQARAFSSRINSRYRMNGVTLQQPLRCSPDGERLLAPLVESGDTEPRWISLCVVKPSGFGMKDSLPRQQGSPLCQLTFCSDGCRVRALYWTGDVMLSGQDIEQPWTHSAIEIPPQGRVHKALVSPNGQVLALVVDSRLKVHEENRHGHWGRGWWASTWHQEFPRDGAHDPAMQFSGNSRHLALAFGNRLFVYSRAGALWREQGFQLGLPVRGQPVFAPDSDLLAQAAAPSSSDGRSVVACVRLWQWRRETDWVCLSRLDRSHESPASLQVSIHPLAGYAVPMAFSPDGQWLAAPAGSRCRDARLLAVNRLGLLALPGQTLRQGFIREHDLQAGWDSLVSLAFNATSLSLAVISHRVLQLWNLCATRGWQQRLRIVGPEPNARLCFAWSPDSYHCAWAWVKTTGWPVDVSAASDVNIWGPGYDGGWVSKLARTCEGSIEQLLFTPDATRLLTVIESLIPDASPAAADSDFHMVTAIRCLHLVGQPPAS